MKGGWGGVVGEVEGGGRGSWGGRVGMMGWRVGRCIHIIYTPNLGLGVTVFVRRRE